MSLSYDKNAYDAAIKYVSQNNPFAKIKKEQWAKDALDELLRDIADYRATQALRINPVYTIATAGFLVVRYQHSDFVDIFVEPSFDTIDYTELIPEGVR